MKSTPKEPLDLATLIPMMEKMPLGISFMKRESGSDGHAFRLLHTNTAQSGLLGTVMAPFHGQLLEEAFAPGHPLRQEELYRQALEGGRTLGPEMTGLLTGKGGSGHFMLWAIPVSSDMLLVLMERRTESVQVGPSQKHQRLERRFSRLLELAPHAMVVVDPKGSIHHLNAEAERIFGYTKKELLGHEVETILSSETDQTPWYQMPLTERSDATMEREDLELRGQRKNGRGFVAEVTLAPLKTGGDLLISAAVRDITERKKAMDAQQQLVAILRSSNDAIISKDRNGIITTWNDGAFRIFGYRADEAIGKSITLLFPTNMLDEESAIDRSVLLEGGRVQHYETIRRRKDGSLVNVSLTISPIRNERGEIIGASKFAHDITARKKVQAELHDLNKTLEERVLNRTAELLKSEHRFHRTLDIMIEGVQIIGFDWRHLYVNEAAAAQSMFTRDELVGHTMMERYPGIEGTPVFKALRSCMKGRTSRVMETEFTFPNGVTKIFHLSIQPIDEGLFILSTDITERKRNELQLQAHREQLEQQNKELEQFAYIASHDLQEPLRMVASFVQLLERRYKDQLGPEANEYISFAVDGTHRMKQLINDLLMYSRLGRPAKQSQVDMDRVFKQVVFDLDSVIKDTQATVENSGLPTITASPTEMQQLLQNLISNAIKFRRPNTPPRVLVRSAEKDGYWQIDVADNGIGIDKAYAKKIFVPFKRLHDRAQYPGTGIGLAVAEKTVKRYGGTIWFDSVLGQGTTFHFTLKQ